MKRHQEVNLWETGQHNFELDVISASLHALANLTQVDKAKEIVKKLTFTFKPDAFENPGGVFLFYNLLWDDLIYSVNSTSSTLQKPRGTCS